MSDPTGVREALTPCPLPECGGEANEFYHRNASGGIRAYRIQCPRCGLIVEHPVPSHAKAMWNRRAQGAGGMPQAWTGGKPKEVGWYWLRTGTGYTEVLFISAEDLAHPGFEPYEGTMHCGPIPEPVEAIKEGGGDATKLP